MTQAQRLMHAYFDGVATPAELAELSQLLKSDPALMHDFARLAFMHARLGDHFSAMEALAQLPAARPALTLAPARPSAAPRWRWWAAVTGIAAALVITALVFFNQKNQPLATIAATDSAIWLNLPSSPAPGDPLPRQQVVLVSGLVRLALPGGDSVIIQGPAAFAIKSPDTIELSRGMLSAVVHAAPGRFSVQTPEAKIIDLGTAFGVRASGAGDTLVEVFQGSVRAESPAGAEILTTGMTTLINHAGMAAQAPGFPFVRTMPERLSLDLEDLLAGGDGTGQREEVGIDIVSGEVLHGAAIPAERFRDRLGRSDFTRIDDGILDGSFTPGGPRIVDSAGHKFTFPVTGGKVCGLVWAGPRVREAAGIATRIGSLDFASPPHRSLILPSNGGLTVNLDAIRKLHPGFTLTTFRALVGNTYYGTVAPIKPRSDWYVLVDGVARFEKKGLISVPQALLIECQLRPDDHFLSLAVSDGSDGTANDWNLWGDAAIEAQSPGP